MFAVYVFTCYKASNLSMFYSALNSGLFYASALLGKDGIMACFGAGLLYYPCGVNRPYWDRVSLIELINY